MVAFSRKSRKIKESEDKPDVRVTHRGGFYMANPNEFLRSNRAQDLIREVEQIPVTAPTKQAEGGS